MLWCCLYFFFQAEDGIRDHCVTGVQTCALPIFFMSGWGVMNQVAVKEAAAIGFKMDHFIGNWWSSSDADVVPAGDGAKGYKGATFHAPGTNFKVHSEIVKHVYDKGKGAGKKEEMGSPLYNRGIVNAMFSAEAIRTAMKGAKGQAPT